MQGIRFINEICKKFNLKVTDACRARSAFFTNRPHRCCNVAYYVLNNHSFFIWISKHKIAITWPSTMNVYRFPISEKYKVLQKINEHLCEELDL